MNICLIRPSKLIILGTLNPQPSPPLGMAYVAGSLKNAGHNVSVIDGLVEAPEQINEFDIPFDSDKLPEGYKIATLGLSPEQILSRIPIDTDVVGFSCMFTNNWLADRQLMNFLGERLPRVIFIAGGESITALAETCLKQVAPLKVCVLGEGEETAIDLMKALESGKSLMDVASIVYKENGNIVRTVKRNRVKNLEQLAPPAWELFRADSYEPQQMNGEDRVRYTLPIMATRGCPYSCTFCTSPDMWGTRYYMRSPKHVADEIEYLADRFGVSNFDFYDLTAIIKKEWIIDFTNIIIERKLDITWRIPAGTRSEAIDDEVARNLYKSGCWSITYAPVGSPRMLKLIKKKVVIKNMLHSMKLSSQEHMRIYINTILALPDEKHLDVWKTLWFLVRCSWVGVNEIGLFVFRAYPGSALFDRLIEEKKISLENDDFFIETIFIIDNRWNNEFYNKNVSKSWYRFYNFFARSVFYGSNFLFRPPRFYNAMRNIINNKQQSAFEADATFALKRIGAFFKRKISVHSQA